MGNDLFTASLWSLKLLHLDEFGARCRLRLLPALFTVFSSTSSNLMVQAPWSSVLPYTTFAGNSVPVSRFIFFYKSPFTGFFFFVLGLPSGSC